MLWFRNHPFHFGEEQGCLWGGHSILPPGEDCKQLKALSARAPPKKLSFFFQGPSHPWLWLYFLTVFSGYLCSFSCLLHTHRDFAINPVKPSVPCRSYFSICVLHEGSSLWFSLHHVISGPFVLAGTQLDEVYEHLPGSDSLTLPALIMMIIRLFSSSPFAAILRIKSLERTWELYYSEILTLWADAFCSVVSIGIG